MLKRLVAALTTALLAVGLTVGVALPASAHTPDISASCAGLTVKFSAYGAGTTNSLKVTIDGTVVESTTFGNDFAQKTYPLSPSTAHSYVVEVDAQHNEHDRTVAKGNAFTGTTTPCTTVTECINPMTQLQNFTILTEGDFRNDTSGAHVEGTLAAGGDLVINQRYTTQNNHDGSPIPTVDGKSTGLLVGGQATLNTANQAFLVMAGAARIGSVPGTAAMKEGDKRYHPVSANSSFVEVTSAMTLDQVKAPGLFAATFSGAFASLRAQADEIAAYTAGDVNFVTMTNSPNGGKQVVLTSGVTNVLRVPASELNGANNLWFAGGTVPSASTPFIIDVTDANSFNVTTPVLRNIDARYVLWNFAKATSIGLNNNEFVKGSILAPRATLTVNSGGIEGQIAVKSLVIKSVGELHHLSYLPCASRPTSVSGAATTTAEVCTADYAIAKGSVTATAKTGVRYELWDAAKATKIADLVAGTPYAVDGGSYAVKVLPASSAYTVSAGNTWIPVTVGDYTGDCSAPQPVSGAATGSAEVCDTSVYEVKPGSVTATAKTGVTYELWDAAKATKIADLVAGTPYATAAGSFFVKVLPASAAFTVAEADTWIAVTVGAYSGVCAQEVTGAATTAAEFCDTADYDVKPGSVTATAKTGVVYELWNVTKTTKIADLVAGTPSATDGGSYFVKVLPASAKFTVAEANTWIAVTVGDYVGVCAKSVSGAASASAEVCDSGDYEVKPGSVTATAAEGVVYELWNAAKTVKIADLTAGVPHTIGAGDYAVKVVAASAKYVVAVDDRWIPVTVGEYSGVCAEPVSGAAATAAETCTVDYAIAQGSVTATAKTGVAYELWNAAKTVKIADLVAGEPYAVDAGSYAVKVLPASDAYTVLPADVWIPVTVGEYTGLCAEPVSGAATTAAEVCETSPYDVKQGSVTATAKTGVVYELWNAAKTTKIADLVAGTAYPIAGGSYAVKVLPASEKYTVSPADTWIAVEVGVNTTVCSLIGDPVQTEECVPNIDENTSDWSATLTIVAVDHVQYRVYFLDGASWVDQGIWPAGVHVAGTAEFPYGTTVKVVAEADAGWNLLAPKEWTYEFQDAFLCDLPDFGIVEPKVTFDHSCSTGPTYTLAIDGGVEGTVLWSVNGGPQTTKLGTFTAPPSGTVQIVATPAPGAGFPGESATLTFGKTFAASVLCDLETLALTGQSSTGGIILAVVLLQAGLGLVALRLARQRRGRHAA